jgi:hypothetical protein
MARITGMSRPLRAAVSAVAVTAVLVAVGPAAVGGARAGTVGPAAAAWSGTFDGFPSAAWKTAWGAADAGTWGFDTMTTSGADLDVVYGKGSSAPSCKNCPTKGGGQFFTDLRTLGLGSLATGPTLDLKYAVKFPTGYDWGRGGKLPGLYGGKIGEESGGVHGNGWSTRYMWRGGNSGEVYFYAPGGDGYGKDLGLGRWHFAADSKWHTVEQLVDRTGQTVTVWYDGRQVYTGSVAGIRNVAFSGVFFSTFFGGHDTGWGPKKTVHAYFGGFSLSATVQH